jgi:predicted molibdopterin-dependent oxidoreductase YjgC
MIKLKIDNKDFEVAEGLTIREVAMLAGIDIVTLCHNNSLPHYSSCMVCMVRDKRSGNFIPSCSALIQEGMDVDCSSEEVIAIRRKAIEMLLSEHRAECEAPCKVVCPAGYNIPLMNRHLSERNYEAALQLVESQIQNSELACINCQAYCENACRRKKIDRQVSIKNIQIFISRLISASDQIPEQQNTKISVEKGKIKKPAKRFTSRIGKLEPEEMKVWLKECSNELKRFIEITDRDSASQEAGSCMHCDCRAANNCGLRDIADKYQVKDPRGKLVNASIEKKINVNTGLIFENAKCIKCGLCVRLCENLKEGPALCFINRGFVSIISEPLTEDFNNILKTKSKEVVEICPTGALSIMK